MKVDVSINDSCDRRHCASNSPVTNGRASSEGNQPRAALTKIPITSLDLLL